MIKTPAGRLRKNRETMRRDAEFDRSIAEEDERQRERARQEPARPSIDPVPPVAAVDPVFDDLLRGFDDDDDDNAADILGPEDYDGEHDAPGGERGDPDEPSSKRHRSGCLSATRATRMVETESGDCPSRVTKMPKSKKHNTGKKTGAPVLLQSQKGVALRTRVSCSQMRTHVARLSRKPDASKSSRT